MPDEEENHSDITLVPSNYLVPATEASHSVEKKLSEFQENVMISNAQIIKAADASCINCSAKLVELDKKTSRMEQKLNRILLDMEQRQTNLMQKIPGPASSLHELDQLLQNNSLVSNLSSALYRVKTFCCCIISIKCV